MTKDYNALYVDFTPVTRLKYIEVTKILMENLIEINETDSIYNSYYHGNNPLTRMKAIKVIGVIYINLLSLPQVTEEDKEKLRSVEPYTRTKVHYSLPVMMEILTKVNNIKPVLTEIRYIRDWINGSNASNLPRQNQWIEGEAIVKGVNVALNKPVTGSFENRYPNNPFSWFTDGVVNISRYVISNPNYGWQWLQIDLQDNFRVEEYRYWHDWSPTQEMYFNHRIEVSADGEYWEVIYDSSTDGTRIESEAGNVQPIFEPQETTP